MKRAAIAVIVLALAGNAIAQHHVDLTCSDSESNVMFNFYRGSGSGLESATPLNSAPLLLCSFSDTNVAALAKYWYVARAYRATSATPLSDPTNEVPVTVPGDAKPLPPTNLQVSATTAKNAVPLMWHAPSIQSDFTTIAYEVWRGSDPTLPHPTMIALVPDTQPSYTDKSCGSLPNRTCYYEVRAFDIDDNIALVESGSSNVVKAVAK